MRVVSYEIVIHASAKTVYDHLTDLMGVPPESTRVEIDLRTHPEGTLLVLTHRLLPDESAEQHRVRVGPLPAAAGRASRRSVRQGRLT